LGRTCRVVAWYLLQAGFLFGLFFDNEDEAACSSETAVDIQRTTWRYIPEDSIFNMFSS
jgi:high-affinity nickel permease